MTVREWTPLPKLKNGMERPSAMKYDAPIVAQKTKIIRTDDDRTKYYERYDGLNHYSEQLRLVSWWIRGYWQPCESQGRNENCTDTHLYMKEYSHHCTPEQWGRYAQGLWKKREYWIMVRQMALAYQNVRKRLLPSKT